MPTQLPSPCDAAMNSVAKNLQVTLLWLLGTLAGRNTIYNDLQVLRNPCQP